MPTGYTADIAKDVSFEEFVWTCARAFVALILMRDDPWDAPIPERFEPTDYHVKAIATAEAEIKRINAMSNDEMQMAAIDEFEKEQTRYREAVVEKEALRTKYEAMLAKANAWKPPTADHCELKAFMIQQISESIKWDCDGSYYEEKIGGVAPSFKVWQHDSLAKLNKDIAYHTEENEKEIERVNSRNRWIEELRKSVSPK